MVDITIVEREVAPIPCPEGFKYDIVSNRFTVAYGPEYAIFIVVALTRGRKSKQYPGGDIISCLPIGTAFALSEDVVFTAFHNVSANGSPALEEIGLVKDWTETDILLDDIIVAKYTAGSEKNDVDWAIYTRDMTRMHFQHYLPLKNDRIKIYDFPLISFTDACILNEPLCSTTKVSTYELWKDPKRTKPKKKRVVKKRPPPRPQSDYRAIQVVGEPVVSGCGAIYIASNGKVVAFHVQTLDDGIFPSISRGLVVCRIPSFMNWYKRTINP